MPKRRKPGRVPKGVRSQLTLRVPTTHAQTYERAARAAGFSSMCDYLAATLAEAHGLEVPDYVYNERHGEELPLAM